MSLLPTSRLTSPNYQWESTAPRSTALIDADTLDPARVTFVPSNEERTYSHLCEHALFSNSKICKILAESLFSFEDEFADHVCIKVDTITKTQFDHFLSPNEGTPHRIIEHYMEENSEGVTISTGTRSLFHVLLNPLCTALVIRDTTPKVKAVIDLIVLLGRLFKTRQEFRTHFRITPKGVISIEGLEGIREKTLENHHLSIEMKNYYLENLETFAHVTNQHVRPIPKIGDSSKVLYFEEDALYERFHQFAQGKIIATIGDIGDLTFLKRHHISIVDTSNICDYDFLDLRGGGKFQPRVIWTRPGIIGNGITAYYSYLHKELSQDVKDKIERCFAIAKAQPTFSNETFSREDIRVHLKIAQGYVMGEGVDIFNSPPITSCTSAAFLNFLPAFIEQNY